MSQRQVDPIVRQIINRDCHVSMTHLAVIRHVVSKLRNGYREFRDMPKRDRRDLMRQCIEVHRDNLQLYCHVMGGKTSIRRQKEQTTILSQTLSGEALRRLMRKHQVTIRELATRLGSTQKRVRQIRERGLQDHLAVRDWVQAITGVDPGPIPQQHRIGYHTEPKACAKCGSPLSVGALAFEYVGDIFCSVHCCRQSRGWE